jgi:hypothetical protein
VVSASVNDHQLLTQTHGAKPHRGALRVGARCSGPGSPTGRTNLLLRSGLGLPVFPWATRYSPNPKMSRVRADELTVWAPDTRAYHRDLQVRWSRDAERNTGEGARQLGRSWPGYSSHAARRDSSARLRKQTAEPPRCAGRWVIWLARHAAGCSAPSTSSSPYARTRLPSGGGHPGRQQQSVARIHYGPKSRGRAERRGSGAASATRSGEGRPIMIRSPPWRRNRGQQPAQQSGVCQVRLDTIRRRSSAVGARLIEEEGNGVALAIAFSRARPASPSHVQSLETHRPQDPRRSSICCVAASERRTNGGRTSVPPVGTTDLEVTRYRTLDLTTIWRTLRVRSSHPTRRSGSEVSLVSADVGLRD